MQAQGQPGVHDEFQASLGQSETWPQKNQNQHNHHDNCLFQIKEKEEARQEYREAVSQGHGAYLMDQDTPVQLVTHSVAHALWEMICNMNP